MNIVLQGWPGIGKTTLVKKIISKLKDLSQLVNGFYTEEIRQDSLRVGFDVVTVKNDRGKLARKCYSPDHKNHMNKVGSYDVYVEEFERVAIPTFYNTTSYLIVDEIGNMELFSEEFQRLVKEKLADEKVIVIATVPYRNNNSLVNFIKTDPNSKLYTVNHANRNQLCPEIISKIVK